MSLQSLFIHTLDHYPVSTSRTSAGGVDHDYVLDAAETGIPCRLQTLDSRDRTQYVREGREPSHRCYLASGRTFSAADRVKISGVFYDVVTADEPLEPGRPQKLLLERTTVQ